MADNAQQVIVTDIKIPFLSMVVLMVKWALAAIPAVIVLIVIGTIISMAMGFLFGDTFVWHGKMM